MKLRIIVILLSIICFLIPIYMKNIKSFYLKENLIAGSAVQACSSNQNLCAEFYVRSCDMCFIPDYSGEVFIRNKLTKQFAAIHSLDMGEYDHELIPTQLIWTDNTQLDIYTEGSKSSNTRNYFFKNLGNVKVIVH